MSSKLHWVPESPAHWDEGKARIVGGAPTGVFDSRYRRLRQGELVPGDWFRVERDGRTVGYGWLDASWGDAEIQIATDPELRSLGIGAFIVDQLQHEAETRGLNYLYNLVRPTHPHLRETIDWFLKRGFKAVDDGRLVREARSRPSIPTP